MTTEKQIFFSLIQKYGPDLKKIAKGSSSIAYEIKNSIIRVPLADFTRYQKEEKLLPIIAPKIHTQIPKVKFISAPINHSIHTKIEGFNWNLNSYKNLTIFQRNKFCEDIATFFYDLHSVSTFYLEKQIDLNILQPYSLPTLQTLILHLNNFYTIKELEKIYQRLILLSQYPKNDIVLCHKDFWHTNSVITKTHRLKGVFDFGNSTLGEYNEDFKTLYKPAYFGLLKNVISIYNNFSSKKVNLERVKQLEDIECFFVFKYLTSFNSLRTSRHSEWLLTLKQIHNFFKRYV